jgi:uncharacterized protein
LKILHNKPEQPTTSKQLILAHGAGAPMDSPFMNVLAAGICAGGIPVFRFEFPYMQERRETGKKRPPNRPPELLNCFQQVINQLGGPESCVVAGKSMGGRMASMLATQLPVAGLICYGYPFHAPGKTDAPRIDHLTALEIPNLILQGDRDPFGKPEEVSAYQLPDKINIQWLPDGDHDFKPRVKSGLTHQQNLETAIEASVKFIAGLCA